MSVEKNTTPTEQKIVRQLKLGDLDLIIRLQKPFEEPEGGAPVSVTFRINTRTGETTEIPDESYIEYGTAIVIEAWSNVTESVVTQGITKGEHQTEAEFAFGARYMLNNGTDEEWIEVLKARKLDKVFKLACDNTECKFKEPTVKTKKKKS